MDDDRTDTYQRHASGLWVPVEPPAPPPKKPPPPIDVCIACGSEKVETTTMGWGWDRGQIDPNRKRCCDCGKHWKYDRTTGEVIDLPRSDRA